MVTGLPKDEMTVVGLRSNSRSLIEKETESHFPFLVTTEKSVRVERIVLKLQTFKAPQI